MVQKLLDLIDNISEWMGRVFSWVIAVLVLLVVLEVILRKFFNSPTIWSFEIEKQIYAFYFMILAGFGLLHKSHVSIDLLYNRVSKRTAAVLDVITYAIFFFPFLLVVLYEGTKFAAQSWVLRETSTTAFSPPIYPIKTIIPLSVFLLLIQGTVIFIRQLHIALKEKDL